MDRPDSTQPSSVNPEQWVDRYGDSLFRYAFSRLRDREAAEEVVQETFVAGLRARDQFEGRGDEGAWLLGICKRKVIDFLRRRSRADAATGGDLGPDPAEALFDVRGNWRADPRFFGGRPEAALEREEFWQALRDCLKRLPTRQADAFTLRELEGLETEEICRALDVSSSNLWVLLHRARLGLAGCLQAHLKQWGLR